MSTNNDDLENFDDSQFDDLEADLDTSYDEPLADDLADADVGPDDEFASDDDWDNPPGDDGEAEQPPPQKKKSSLLTYIIIGVVVLVGGGVALMTLGGGQPAPQATAEGEQPVATDTASLEGLRDEAMQQQETPAVAPPVEGEATAPAEAPQGFMNETGAPPAAVPGLPPGPALTAVDTPAPSADSLPVVPPAPAAEQPADPAVIGGLQPVSDFPSVDLIKKADAPSAPAAEVPPVEAAPVSVAEAPQGNPAELAVLQGKLDAALGKVESLEKELTTVKAAPAPKADTSASDAKIEDLQATVTRLEKQLALEKAAAKAAAQEVKETPVAVPATREEEPSPIAAVESEPEVAAPVAPAPVKSVVWELRGAQPGKAILSRKGSSDDIRTVSVGDSIPGLGRILSIDQSQKGWVVQGTSGRILQ